MPSFKPIEPQYGSPMRKHALENSHRGRKAPDELNSFHERAKLHRVNGFNQLSRL
jgi:hypothetical protein